MAKFTPGPWESSRENNVWGRNNETQVACCRSRPGCGMLWNENEIKANARLIAAAPDMYAALEAIVGEAAFEGLPECKQEAIIAALSKAVT